DIFTEDSLEAVYQAKARILNDALQEIGMGKYPWYLFVVAGFGWIMVVDAPAKLLRWPVVTGLILTPVANEFNVLGPWLKLAKNIGLLVGAAFWGVLSDIWGRRCVPNCIFSCCLNGMCVGGPSLLL
ncbi:hypothetical protein EDB19DRAFT_1647952, partial [Suillus lakei]